MLQIKCNCGRIAEVRHRKNGKKLAFIHCVNGCGGLVNATRAAEIEAAAVEDIGVKGEFFDKPAPVPNEASKTAQSSDAGDFKPAPEDLPENLEINSEFENVQSEQIPAKQSNILKIAVGVLGVAVFGGGVYSLSKMKG